MNVYITKLNGMSFRSEEQHIQHMTADTAHLLGMREMGIYRYNADQESAENRGRRLDGIIAGMCAGDIVICQFPTWNGLAFEQALVRHIKAYHGRIMIFVHALEAVVSESHAVLQDTVRLYNEAEVLIVPSYGMKQFLKAHGIRSSMKFIVQEIYDYTTQWNASGPGRLNQGNHVQKMNGISYDRLLPELSKGGFGLVWYADETGYLYLSLNNSPALSMYLAAGIPVIVPRGISSQCMIERNHLGIVVDTLEEAAETVEKITEQEYQEYVSAVAQFAPLLRKGFFTEKSLVDALQMSMRKDMYVYTESDETYVMPVCVFEYVCLREAYRNNLALSWIFRGEAEGFLIYDADSGNLVGEVFHGLEHYLLLKNDVKGTRFVVKAYIRTVKGKMIVAESGIAEISERYSAQNKVSVIIPAYNAEKFIARGMDTVLAQSFTDLEIVIVNDGSTDQTQKIIDWYKTRYPQVKSFYQPNAGQAVARNLGVKHAKGDYIGFMDSDDMLRPDMIEKLYNSILKNECDIAMTSAYQMTNEGYEEVGFYSMEENTAVSVEDFFAHYIRYAYPVIWNKLYKKMLVEEHPIPAVTYEDSAWMPYILSYAGQICYLNEHLYEYDRIIRNTTYIHDTVKKPIEEQFKDRRDYVMFFLENGNPQKRHLLKKLALGYAFGFLDTYSYPRFLELREEIEQF